MNITIIFLIRHDSLVLVCLFSSNKMLFILVIFISSTWGFGILLMDSAYNYDAKNDGMRGSSSYLVSNAVKLPICQPFNLLDYIKR